MMSRRWRYRWYWELEKLRRRLDELPMALRPWKTCVNR